MHLHTITYSSRQSAIEVARKHRDDVVILHSFKARDGNKAILAVDNDDPIGDTDVIETSKKATGPKGVRQPRIIN